MVIKFFKLNIYKEKSIKYTVIQFEYFQLQWTRKYIQMKSN